MPARSPLSPAIILVRTQEAGNIGATARAMANMGLSRLILVAPRAELSDPAAAAFAVGARHLLDDARQFSDLETALERFECVVGTTSERERSPSHPALLADELAGQLQSLAADTPVAMVFGPEASGLTRDELALCNLVVRIPTSAEHPTLNLAQAVLVLAYELQQARRRHLPVGAGVPDDPDERPAPFEQIHGLAAQFDELMHRIGFARDSSYDSARRDLRVLLGRAMPNRRELRILRGIARRIANTLSRESAVIESSSRPQESNAEAPEQREESG